MTRANSVMKKMKNRIKTRDKFCNRRENLFKKAHELSVLCEAEVAIILINSNGKVSEFASTNMDQILTRLNMCLKSQNYPTLKFIPEEPEEEIVTEEVDALRREEQEVKIKQWKFLGKDLTDMGLYELLTLQERLTEGILYIKNRKLQLLEEEIEKSRMLGYQAFQRCQALAEQCQDYVPPIFNPVPLSVYNPETDGATASHGPEDDCNNEPSDEESDTTAVSHSRIPPGVGSEMKTFEDEARSFNPRVQ